MSPPHTAHPGRVEAACHRCGARKAGPLVPCKACGVAPTGAERAVAWLLSLHHLSPEELDEAARRIRAGEVPDPPRALLRRAREAMMGADPPAEGDRPLPPGQVVLLALGNLVLTPLLGLAAWWGWREDRPSAARQALRVTLPVALALWATWAVVVAARIAG